MTDDDIIRKKGRGPKPKGERRKRVKKEVVKEAPRIKTSRPHVGEEIMWRTGEPSPPGGYRNRGYGTRRAGWQPKPVSRTLDEAVLSGRNIRPSGPIPHSNYVEVNGELEKLNEERQALEGISERMDKQEKKLALMIVRLDRVEERLNAQVDKLCESLEQFDSKIQAFSNLVSHIVSAQGPNRRQPR